MNDQSSVESSVDNSRASHLHPFDYDTDWESIESSTPSRKKSSGGRGDTSEESSWLSLEDHGHFSSNNASDDELGEDGHDIHSKSNIMGDHSSMTCTIASKTNVPSFVRTHSLLCETDSLLLRRLSPRRRKERSSMNNDQRGCGEKSQNILNSPRLSKEHIPQFAIIEWDEIMMTRRVHETENSSSEEGKTSKSTPPREVIDGTTVCFSGSEIIKAFENE